MATTNVKILLRRGSRSEISADTLSAGEMGFADDTNQVYIGTVASVDEIVFDPFANAHAIVQSFLNQHTVEVGLEIDEDLIIRNVSDVPVLLTAMETYGIIDSGSFVIGKEYKIKTIGTTDFVLIGSVDSDIGTIFTATGVGTGTGIAIDTYDHFYANIFASERRNVEVLTENSFSQAYANLHLQSHTASEGRRPDLFKKSLTATVEIISVGAIVLQRQYEIISLGTDTLTTISSGAFVIDDVYTILVPGDTDFTLIGAADSVIGTTFTATGVGIGTGTATYVSTTVQEHWEGIGVPSGTTAIVGTKFVASSVGTGTGTVREGNTFLKYSASECTSFFIDYSLKQTNGSTTFIRIGTIKVINGAPQDIKNTSSTHYLTKLTDDNTEIWQDAGVIGTVEPGEFSNIEFIAEDILIGDDWMKINFTQDANFTTEISYTVKRWTM
jgi:hypothetical protein